MISLLFRRILHQNSDRRSGKPRGTRLRIGPCVALHCLLSACLIGCTGNKVQPVPVDSASLPHVGERLPYTPLKGFPIGVGDKLAVTVWSYDDLSRIVRVDPSGNIYFPLVGPIKAAGIGTEDLREHIAEGLVKYIVSPQVSVDISEFRSRKINVIGEVNKPGTYVIEDALTVVDAISLAGDVTRHANYKKVILIRKTPTEVNLLSVNLYDLLYKGDMSQMVYLAAGDIIFAPPTSIEEVARFFDYMQRIIRPLRDAATTAVLIEDIYDIIIGEDGQDRTLILNLGE